MSLEAILQFGGTVAVTVLMVLFIILSRRDHVALFVTSGQSVFKWTVLTLATVFITRLFVVAHILNQTASREINSIFFIVTVLGIVWSVGNHGKPK